MPTPSIPLISSAPMLFSALPPLATSVSLSGGLGFLAGGLDLTPLSKNLAECKRLLHNTHLDPTTTNTSTLPIGVGVITWGCSLPLLTTTLKETHPPPRAIWLFAPKDTPQLAAFADAIRTATNSLSQIWIQIVSVTQALEVTDPSSGVWPDVLVVQGGDAGGHGLKGGGAGIISLLPEVRDALVASDRKTKSGETIPLVAAGGIVDVSRAAAFHDRSAWELLFPG